MSTESHREVEAKFQVSSGEAVNSLHTIEKLTPEFTLTPAQSKTHLDTYYDTASFHLLRAGYVLRVRVSGTSVKVAVKGLVSESKDLLHDRLEVEQQIHSAGRPPYQDDWSGDLRQIVAHHIDRKAELEPIVALRQNRVKRNVVQAVSVRTDGQHTLAELSIDQAAVLAPSSDTPVDTARGEVSATATFLEVELESRAEETVFPLGEVARQLAETYQLQRVRTSKLERALLALHSRSAQDPSSPAGIQLDMPMAEAVRLIWRTQMMRALLCEHGARADLDIEYVHDLRVAIRRARTAERLFGRHFRRAIIKPYFDTWKQLARLAGAVRDLDVALINLSEFQNRLQLEESDDLGEMRRELQQHRQRAQMEMVDWLDSKSHSEFVSGFSQFCASSGAGVRKRYAHADVTEPIQVRYVMPGIILECFQHVRAHENLLKAPLEVGEAKRLHALRIDCKYLRYVLEFGRDLLGAPGESLITQLKLIQDQLGDLNDISVEERRLQHLQAELTDNSVLHARLHDLDGHRSHLLRSFPPIFNQFVSEENRHIVALALASL